MKTLAQYLWMIGSAALVGVGCSSQAAESPKGPPGGGRPALVKVEEARGGQLEDRWSFLGNVRSLSRASLSSGASGEVGRVDVREGDAVTNGQILATVDLQLASARLKVADAGVAQGTEELAQAQREFKRFLGLQKLNAGSLSELEVERAQSNVESLKAKTALLEATAAEARAMYERHLIRAPFAGVVSLREVDPGDWVDIGDPMLGVVSTAQAEVVVDAPAKLFGRVKQGDEVAIVGSQESKGTVAGVVPALDPTTRTLRVRIQPEPSANWLMPGGAVDVQFSIDLSGEGIVVPQDALVKDGDGVRVVRIVDAKADIVTVNVLATSRGNALVMAPTLSIGDQLVTRGNERLRPGQAIEVVD